MRISIIVAVASNGVIGKNNDLPWRLPRDLDFFKQKTTGHWVIMGRKNWESIPEKYRPLSNRRNLIMTRQDSYEAPGGTVIRNLNRVLEDARQNGETEIFIIGGADIYSLVLPEIADTMYVTKVHQDFEGDTFFPEYDESNWKLVSEEHHGTGEKNKWPITFCKYERVRK